MSLSMLSLFIRTGLVSMLAILSWLVLTSDTSMSFIIL